MVSTNKHQTCKCLCPHATQTPSMSLDPTAHSFGEYGSMEVEEKATGANRKGLGSWIAFVPIFTISHLGYAAAFCLALFGCCIPNPCLGLQPDWNHLSISLPEASHCLQTLFCSLSVIVLSYTHQQLISAPPVLWTVTLPPRLFRQHLRPLCLSVSCPAIF